MIFTIPKRGHYITTKPWLVDLTSTIEDSVIKEKEDRIHYPWRYTAPNSLAFDEIAHRIKFFRNYLESCIKDDGFKQAGDFALEVPAGLVFNLKRLQLSTQKHTIVADVHPKYNKIKSFYEVGRLFSMVDNVQIEAEYIDDPADLKLIAKDKAIWMKSKGY